MASLLPDPQLFLYAYVRREAVLSSQIEGTQSSLSDLLLFELDELPGVPFDDVVEGMAPLREVHQHLMARGRGAGKEPGEFRRTQNRIGGTRPGKAHFVPPPPQEVQRCVAELESYIHSASARAGRCRPTASKPMQTLVEAGIARELTGQRRNRVFVYDAYLGILNEGGAPL